MLHVFAHAEAGRVVDASVAARQSQLAAVSTSSDYCNWGYVDGSGTSRNGIRMTIKTLSLRKLSAERSIARSFRQSVFRGRAESSLGGQVKT